MPHSHFTRQGQFILHIVNAGLRAVPLNLLLLHATSRITEGIQKYSRHVIHSLVLKVERVPLGVWKLVVSQVRASEGVCLDLNKRMMVDIIIDRKLTLLSGRAKPGFRLTEEINIVCCYC